MAEAFGPLYTEGIISFGVIGIYKYHLTFYSLLRINTYVKILYFRYEVFHLFYREKASRTDRKFYLS